MMVGVCHSERSEESVCIHMYASTLCLQILRLAQDDIFLSIVIQTTEGRKNLGNTMVDVNVDVLEILRFAQNDNGG